MLSRIPDNAGIVPEKTDWPKLFTVFTHPFLDNIGKINHLPLIIVHGRYDVITRPKGAWELHQKWPGSELVLVDASGHASSEPGISEALAAATEKMKNQHGADFQQTVTF